MNARPSADWVKQSVIYEIDFRSDSANRSFQALESQVPDLEKLGITVVSLFSIHPIGELNRKGRLGNPYAVKDFYSVNPDFGSLGDLKSLIRTAHRHGLKIIIPLAMSQAAWDSRLLMEHPEWFVQNEEGAIVSPNLESSDVAQLDFHQHELRKYMIVMMKFWIQEIDADGFRCHAADLIPTDFWDVARSELDRTKPVMLISESMVPEFHVHAFDISCSWDMNGVCSNIGEGKSSAAVINDSLTAEFHRFPKGSLHLRSITHIEPRRENLQKFAASDPEMMKMVTGLAFTLPGIPFLSAGRIADRPAAAVPFSTMNENVIALRRNHPSLQNGSYRIMPNSDSTRLFSFIRTSGADSVLMVFNFARKNNTAKIQMPAGVSEVWKEQFSEAMVQLSDSVLKIDLAPMEIMALAPNSMKGK